jgi:Short C-terminal domain
MSETAVIIGEIIVGIALLSVLTMLLTVWASRLLGKGSAAGKILRERYARGELTREQFEQMRQDLGTTTLTGDSLSVSMPNGRHVGVGRGSRETR